MLRGLTSQLLPATYGALGGVALDVTIGYVNPYLPLQLTTGWGAQATRIGGAVGLGMLARQFFGKPGADIAHGMVTIAIYGLVKSVLVQFAPTVPGLSGAGEDVIDTGNLIKGGGAGAYLRGFLPSGEVARGVGRMGRVGAYLHGVDSPIMAADY